MENASQIIKPRSRKRISAVRRMRLLGVLARPVCLFSDARVIIPVRFVCWRGLRPSLSAVTSTDREGHNGGCGRSATTVRRGAGDPWHLYCRGRTVLMSSTSASSAHRCESARLSKPSTSLTEAPRGSVAPRHFGLYVTCDKRVLWSARMQCFSAEHEKLIF